MPLTHLPQSHWEKLFTCS